MIPFHGVTKFLSLLTFKLARNPTWKNVRKNEVVITSKLGKFAFNGKYSMIKSDCTIHQ